MHEVRLLAGHSGAAVDQFSMGYWVAVLSFGVSVLGVVVGMACILHGARSVRFRLVWVTSAAVATGGVGVWLATSVALLGVDVSGTVVRFDGGGLVTSLVSVVVTTFGALLIIGRTMQWKRLIPGGLVMGLGIGLTLYLGIGSIRIQGSVEIAPLPATLAVVLALCTGVATLWSVQVLRGRGYRAATIVLFGIAVAGTYYLGVAALDVHIDAAERAPAGMPLFEFVFPMFVVGSLALTVPITALLVAPDRRETAATVEATRRAALQAAR